MRDARPSNRPRSASRRRTLLLVACGLAAGVAIAGAGLSEVVLQYTMTTRAAGAPSPFKFVNGANYGQANGQGLFTTTYPNVQQVSVGATASGASGAYGSYLLDVLEVQANATSASGWHLRIDVTAALVATGVNAAYAFYCTAAPTTVPDTGVPLASGVDVRGNPWAIFAPTCAGTQVALPLTAPTVGSALAFASLTAGSMLLSISFGLAVTNTGASTTTPATLTLVAMSP